jgi:hypothetical protein
MDGVFAVHSQKGGERYAILDFSLAAAVIYLLFNNGQQIGSQVTAPERKKEPTPSQARLLATKLGGSKIPSFLSYPHYTPNMPKTQAFFTT